MTDRLANTYGSDATHIQTLKTISDEVARILAMRNKHIKKASGQKSYRSSRMQTSSVKSVVDPQPTLANKVPKFTFMTPIKWGSSPFKKLSSTQRLSKTAKTMLLQERIFETLLAFLTYDQLMSCSEFFPFSSIAKYALMVRRTVAFQIISGKISKGQRMLILSKQVSKFKEGTKGITALVFYQKMYVKDCKDIALIKLDIQRTVGTTLYNAVLERIVKGLVNALGIGYCQGMNFLAVNLYSYLKDEEKTFWTLLVLFKKRGMEDLYLKEMAALKKTCEIIDALVKDHLPTLWIILNRNGLNSEYYALQWILTLFAFDLPQELSWKILDGVLSKGWTIVYSSVLAILNLFMKIIEDKGIVHDDDCVMFVKDYPKVTKINEAEFVKVMYAYDKKIAINIWTPDHKQSAVHGK